MGLIVVVDLQTGRPCVSFLDEHDQWIPGAYSLQTILIYLQFLLVRECDGSLAWIECDSLALLSYVTASSP